MRPFAWNRLWNRSAVPSQDQHEGLPPLASSNANACIPSHDGVKLPAELRKLRPGRWVRDFCFDWCVILAAFTVFATVQSNLLLPLVALVIGARMHALGLLAHDVTHRLAFKQRRLNDLVGEVFIAWPLFLVLEDGYHPWHFSHHRQLGTEDDPELSYRADAGYVSGVTWGKVVWYFALDMLGLGIVDLLKFMKAVFPSKRPQRMIGPVVLWLTFLAWTLWLNCLWIFGLWAWSVVTGFWAVFRVRTWTEHIEVPPCGKETSHRFSAGRLARFFFFPHNTYCHYEHHKWP
jgi:fatty acid desaturase